MPRRAQSLQSARTEHDAFCSGRNHLLQFLSHIPSYEPQETDSLGQVETKLNNQKVSGLGVSNPFVDRRLVSVLDQRAPSTHVSELKDRELTAPSPVPCMGPGLQWTPHAGLLNKWITAGTPGSPHGGKPTSTAQRPSSPEDSRALG